MKLEHNNRRYKIKEIICENPANIVTNIIVYSKDGSVFGTASSGTLCYDSRKETISFTFSDNLYIEKRGEDYILIRE